MKMNLKSAKISTGKKRSVWSDRDTEVLLQLWAERATDLRCATRNRHIYREISLQMNNTFSPEEVHVKIRNFTQKYREEKKEMGPYGGNSSNWKYYDAVHRIIESTAANSAEISESFSFINSLDASCQPSPESLTLPTLVSKPLSSPVSQPLSSPPSLLTPLYTMSTSAAAASSSSGEKRNHLGEVVKIMKEQNISKEKKRSVWCDRDTQVLLELWAERAADLRRAKRNRHIFQEISEQMNNTFSPEEVHVKIRNFTQKYREEKTEMGPSGERQSNWKYYDAVHRIIGSTGANSAEISESSSLINILDENCEASPESLPLLSPVSDPLLSPMSKPLPVLISSPPSLLPPLNTTSTSAAAASSPTGKKRNHLGEVLKIMKEQNVMLKSVVEDSQSLSYEIVTAIREQNETAKEFITLMKSLIDKI